LHFCTAYFLFAQAGHTGTCLRPLHIFALLCFAIWSRDMVVEQSTVCQCLR